MQSRDEIYLSCMKLQLKHYFDLVLLTPPPPRLEHFPYFTLNHALLSDLTLQEPAGALPGDHRSSGDHRRKITIHSKHHQCNPKLEFRAKKSYKHNRKSVSLSKIQVSEQLTQRINAELNSLKSSLANAGTEKPTTKNERKQQAQIQSLILQIAISAAANAIWP